MSHVKAGGSSKNIHNNAGQRLGVKVFGGQKSERWSSYRTSSWCYESRRSWHLRQPQHYHADKDGVVKFVRRKIKRALPAKLPGAPKCAFD